MSELIPDMADNQRLISVVMCPNGYQALIEERVPISFYPHFSWIQKAAKARTPAEAIKKALTEGQRIMI